MQIKRNMAHTQKKKAVNRNCPWMLDLIDKIFKLPIADIFKITKGNHV